MAKTTKEKQQNIVNTQQSSLEENLPLAPSAMDDNLFEEHDERVEVIADADGEIAVTSPPSNNVVVDATVIDEAQNTEGKIKQSRIRKLGAPKDDNKPNKFDLFFIKLWSYIVSIIIGISTGINIVIKAIFKKKAPDKYVRASVSVLLVICLLLLFILPFQGGGTKETGIEIYSNGLIPVKQSVFNNGNGYPQEKWGFADKKGKIVIPVMYDEALPFMHGVAWVRMQERDINGTITDDYWQLIDKRGKLKGGLKFTPNNHDIGSERPVGQFSKDVKLAWVKTVGVNGIYGYINNSGRIKIQYNYDYAENFSDGLARVRMGRAEFFINSKGKQIGDQYDEVRQFSCGLGAIQRNDLWGFMNVKGKVIVTPSYNAVSQYVGDYAAVRRGDAYGIIDVKGKLIIAPIEFSDIYTLSEEFRELILSIKRV